MGRQMLLLLLLSCGGEEEEGNQKEPTWPTPGDLPADTNTYGNIFGGALVALIDKLASISASRPPT